MFAAASARRLATLLAAAQLCAVAHLALVPHTSTVSGAVASSGHDIEEHLDAMLHGGAHAHAPSPPPRPGEEHCTVVGLLRASSAGPGAPPALALFADSQAKAPAPAAAPALSRRERLLFAPKASPPASPLT